MSDATFSPTARHDVLELLDYIAAQDVRAAAEFVDRIEAECQMLAQSPTMGFQRDDLSSGLRCWPVGGHVIFNRRTGSGIDVVRVVHGSRDLSKFSPTTEMADAQESTSVQIPQP
jgi:toxin ParE1/3/4